MPSTEKKNNKITGKPASHGKHKHYDSHHTNNTASTHTQRPRKRERRREERAQRRERNEEKNCSNNCETIVLCTFIFSPPPSLSRMFTLGFRCWLFAVLCNSLIESNNKTSAFVSSQFLLSFTASRTRTARNLLPSHSHSFRPETVHNSTFCFFKFCHCWTPKWNIYFNFYFSLSFQIVVFLSFYFFSRWHWKIMRWLTV